MKEALINGDTDGLSLEEIVTKYLFPNNFRQIINEADKLFELESKKINPILRTRSFKIDF